MRLSQRALEAQDFEFKGETPKLYHQIEKILTSSAVATFHDTAEEALNDFE